jgi:hypothetical protein
MPLVDTAICYRAFAWDVLVPAFAAADARFGGRPSAQAWAQFADVDRVDVFRLGGDWATSPAKHWQPGKRKTANRAYIS